MNPSKEALKDINEYLRNNKEIRQNELRGIYTDVYIVGEKWLRSKETTELNRELGIYSINKIGNTNFNKK